MIKTENAIIWKTQVRKYNNKQLFLLFPGFNLDF